MVVPSSPLPDPFHTTITNEANWSYNNNLDGKGGDGDAHDGTQAPGGGTM